MHTDCPTGCADATSCKCPADQPAGAPVCGLVGGTYAVTQPYVHYEWIEATQECLGTTVPHVSLCGTAGCADGQSCATAAQCDPNHLPGHATPLVRVHSNPWRPTGHGDSDLSAVRLQRLPHGVRVHRYPDDAGLPHGCADGKSCAGPGGGRGERCVPSECERPEEPIGDSRCVFRPDDQKWILERDYRYSVCNPVAGGDEATCEQTTITRCEKECTAGCAADGKSCAGSGGISCAPSGNVPAAPSEFEVSQRPEGTKFWWRDNATNETGYRIYFGSRSLGEPAELLKDVVGVDAVGAIIPWKRTGGATCWELNAYNAAGESTPARYCLPE